MSTPSPTYVIFHSQHGDRDDQVSTYWGNSREVVEHFLDITDFLFKKKDMKMIIRNKNTLIKKISSTDIDFNFGRIYDGDLYSHVMISSRETTEVVEIVSIPSLYKFFGEGDDKTPPSKKKSVPKKVKKVKKVMSSSEEESGSEREESD